MYNAYLDLTKHDLLGAHLQANIYNYFSQNDLYNAISNNNSNQIIYRSPSYGQFQTNVPSQYWFWIPRNIDVTGVVMDVDQLSSIGADSQNNEETRKDFNSLVGYRASMLENTVPERLNENLPQDLAGVSATKIFTLAMSAGQKIFTLTLSNVDQLNNITIDNRM